MLSSIAIALVALSTIIEATPISESTERVFGGIRARPGQFPHQVSIRKPFGIDSTWHVCGGVLISDRFVLTAANCTQGPLSYPPNVTVVVGTHLSFPNTPGSPYEVSKITNHPQFDRNTMANDISVVKTIRKVQFTTLVQPIKLPTENIPNGFAATISGWGKFDVRIFYLFLTWIAVQKLTFVFLFYFAQTDSFPYVSTFLLFKHTIILERSQCIERLGALGDIVHENTVCTTNPIGNGTRDGDFGGPLIHRNDSVLIGLASWTRECGQGYPDVYTNVYSHLQFIYNAMNEQRTF